MKNNITDINTITTLSQQLTSALYESTISTVTNTTMQSVFNKDTSFKEVLKNQLINTSVGALANIGAKQIGKLYHGTIYVDNNGNPILDNNNNVIYAIDPSINKATQLTLHAGLGAITSTLTGNDALSGAVSGVTGELFAELYSKSMYDDNMYYDNMYDNNITYNINPSLQLTKEQKNTLKELGGLAGGLSALITGKVSGLDSEDIASNIYSGQRIGKNTVENNLLGTSIISATSACLANPTCAAALATGLITAAMWLQQNSEEIGKGFTDLGNAIGDGLDNIYDSVFNSDEKQNVTENQDNQNSQSGSVMGSPMMDPNEPDKDEGKEDSKSNNQGNKEPVRTEPRNLEEKLALDEAKANPQNAQNITDKINIGDPKYKDGWSKMQYIHQNPDGTKTVIHYWKETATGVMEGFKFK